MNEQTRGPLTQLRRDLFLWMFIDACLTGSVAWLFLWGGLAVILRVALRLSPLTICWGATGAVVVLALSLWYARRTTPSEASLRAAVDNCSHAGGLVMAEAEIDVSAWRSQIPDLKTPRVRYRGKTSLLLLGIALVFLLTALLIPEKYTVMTTPHSFDLENATMDLEQQIELLADEELVSQDDALEMTADLQRVQDEAAGDDPARTWTALDHLQERVSNAAQEAAESQARVSETLARAEALAQAVSAVGRNMAADELASSMEALRELLEKAQAERGQAASEVLNDLLKELDSGQLNAADLKALAQTLNASAQDIADLAKRLQEAGLIDGELAAKCKALSQAEIDALLAALEEDAEKSGGHPATCAGLLAAAGQCAGGNLAGRGGVNRGRGDAPMTWRDKTNEENVKFQENVLPPGALGDLQDSVTIGVTATAPDVSQSEDASTAAPDNVQRGSGTAPQQRVLPRHRQTVKSYFKRDD